MKRLRTKPESTDIVIALLLTERLYKEFSPFGDEIALHFAILYAALFHSPSKN